jgi:hypothetical protein
VIVFEVRDVWKLDTKELVAEKKRNRTKKSAEKAPFGLHFVGGACPSRQTYPCKYITFSLVKSKTKEK